ncbi:S8 family serine peptidase [Umezawaea endophytica]|uniref:S8 family serine peptidase n=1 Tax=Umezawaea endophytica TaxID=1654476 RepID=A0A9X2VGU2_9PSEU|nr:S8 family serine peptidase [Umezawaea endophytica]MCS7475867.1 S8 family serine peptidase [Umezawaea endophytica]
MRRLKRPPGPVLLAAVLTFALVAPPGGAPAQAAPAGDPVSTPESRVTLITGDRVTSSTIDGRTSVRVEPAARDRTASFREFTRDGDTYVVPADAAGAVSSGLLDLELFNVTGLLRQGYDDAHTPTLPLLVQQDAAARVATPSGGTVRRELPDVGMTALDATKADVARFWGDLATGERARAAGAVRKVWLNGRVRANLDQSVPRIGAPTAWAAGLTGRGVRVAVLDTGIDTDHPDLVGKVEQSQDFSGKGTVEDGHGHGTHVASAVVGSGAASGGRNRGVAPDAGLAVGKVLDDYGSGSFDAIIAGMTWAAAETGAKVVNMSLGDGRPSDGTDPISAAVNTLTRDHGTLFVVAAGNSGADGSVSSPAAADAALAVGSVSKQDVPSPFSSRGPRDGDGAVKPEIAAPGEDVVAAMPSGVPPLGEPVGDAYQRLSGTSMAAPHVAGSAAILAQQHPDWTSGRLKDALVSSAVEVAGTGPFGVGAGRVDVARATATPVVATGAVSAFLPWPNRGAQEKRTATWHNSGAAPVTLALRADLPGAPDGLVALSASSVTVPAGGDASVELTVTAKDRPGTFPGVLTATSGSVTTRTALSVRQQEEMYHLSVTATDRNGDPVPADVARVTAQNLDTGRFTSVGAEPVRLPKGRYVVDGLIQTPRPGQEPSSTLISHPELVLDHDVTQVLDARDGKRFSAEPDNAAARGGSHEVGSHRKVTACDCTWSHTLSVDPRLEEVYGGTVPGTGSDGYAMAQVRRATEPVLELAADDGRRFDVKANWLDRAGPAESLALPVAHGGAGTPEDLARIDANGRLVVLELPANTGFDELGRRVAAVKAAGGRLVLLVFSTSGLVQLRSALPEPFALPTMYSMYSVTGTRFTAYARTAGATATYASNPLPEHRYELVYGVEKQVTADQVHRPRTSDLVEVTTAYHDNAAGEVRYNAAREFFGRWVGFGLTQPAAAQQERKEYFTPGRWQLMWSSAWRGLLTDTRELTVGGQHRIAWNKAVASPSLRGLTQTYVSEPPRPWAWRKDDVFDLSLPMHGDAVGRPRKLDVFPEMGMSGSISLYRGGTLVATVPEPDRATIPVPAQDDAYRLVVENHVASDRWPLSTTVSAEWTFRSSSAADAKALPLLTTRFDPAVDLRNRAPAGRLFSFPVHVERHDGAVPGVRPAVEVSYDDGRTWEQAGVRAAGDHWTATVRHPGSGYASLRATATAADGTSVRQTVLRAYQVGG